MKRVIGIALTLATAAVASTTARQDVALKDLMPAGTVIGVAITVLILGHGALQRGTFDTVYELHVAFALLTAVICAFVNTRPIR